jgi:hypothetical protein
MLYPFISVAMLVIFIVYIAYILLIKKDKKQFQSVVYVGLFFIAIWLLLYYFLLQ